MKNFFVKYSSHIKYSLRFSVEFLFVSKILIRTRMHLSEFRVIFFVLIRLNNYLHEANGIYWNKTNRLINQRL